MKFAIPWGWLTTALWLSPWFFPQASQALIVVDGKVVSEWPVENQVERQSAAHALAKKAGSLAGPSLAAATKTFYPSPKGEIRALALLVDFSDQAPAFTLAEIQDWLNLKGFNRHSCNGSVQDFYRDISNGQVTLLHDVAGFYRASKPKSYYENTTSYDKAAELVAEVLKAFDEDVDFSKYDNDGDGIAESISIVYAGFGLEWSQGLWPHAGYINERRDGVRLTRYMMTDMHDRFQIFTFCHEVGHMVFGWPDLYGFGDYCLMANNSSATNPTPVNDFFRADQGWIGTVDITAQSRAFYKAEAPAMRGFRYVRPDKPGELFFWSHVRKNGRWSILKGSGLLLLHFDQSIKGNDPPNPLSLAVVQADGLHELDDTVWPRPGSDIDDYFQAATKSEWSAATGPDNQWHDGKATGLRIFEIGPLGDSIGFYVGDAKPVSLANSKRSRDSKVAAIDANGKRRSFGWRFRNPAGTATPNSRPVPMDGLGRPSP
jgi:M6 family metalloprotease-like protein